MGESLLRILVSTQSGLISIRDMHTEDQPEVQTGSELFTFLPGHVFITVRPDFEGDVAVEFIVDGQVDLGVPPLFDRVMQFDSGALCASDVVDPDEELLKLPRAGAWRVKVYTEGTPWPHKVTVVFDRDEWNFAY
ncbi:hypothetical protein [Streptomyces sp. NPDC048489]|uniref:hypothetical protein n=1 Tax=Streptomyces sp. NPDC048489 TaxID=3154504 RepID=UPI003435EA85